MLCIDGHHKECDRKYFSGGCCMQFVRSSSIYPYSITHRHPAVPSAPSLPLANALLFDASSSSTISCGLTVICTTFADSVLNLHSVGRTSQHPIYKETKSLNDIRITYPSMASCHPITARNKSIVCCWDCSAVFPTLPSTPARSIPSAYTH